MNNKIKTWYMNLSIKYKMLIFFYGMIIIISTILGFYSYMLSSNNIESEISETSFMDVRQIGNSMDSLQNDINDLSTFTILNKEVQSVLKSNDPYNSENIDICKQMIDHLLISKNSISFVSIYGDNGFEYYSSADGSSGINSLYLIKQSTIYKEMLIQKGRPLWVLLNKENQVFITNNKNPKVAMCRTIYDTNNYNKLGIMVLYINISYLEKFYTDNILNNNRSLLLLDNNNQIINYKNFNSRYDFTGNDLNKIEKIFKEPSGKGTVDIANKQTMVSYTRLENSKWRLLYLIPKSEFLSTVKSIFNVTLAVIIGCLLISFVIYMYISSNLTSPIKKLLKAMEKVNEGDFRRKIDFKYNDEIGTLGKQYNEMIDNISNLIEKVYKLQIKEKEAELKALQAQINPHFLYNTLDTIFWKAEKAKEKDISEMVYALSKIFRLTLNNGDEATLVRAEKEFIEYYLLLQKNRYKDKLTYSIEMEEEILNFKIPKLILQPFVENAIIYGTEKDDEQSLITIKGVYKNGKINFSIEDNGIGMSQEKIQELLNISSKVDHLEGKRGYAIYNINQRLNLCYNNDYELIIDSEMGKGTKILLIIPTEIEKFEWRI
ncbi:MAG: sensor histidine kinase [Clostridiaceae bacterium]|nr:sensor histidine kinase [Clostridiaceae bacterium]